MARRRPQPAYDSYFFGPSYFDMFGVIGEAWELNKDKAEDFLWEMRFFDSSTRIRSSFKWIASLGAMVSVMLFGTLFSIALALVHIAVLLVATLAVYIAFIVIWTMDRLYLLNKRIFTACHECKQKSLIPTYICPKCGAEHSRLVPGRYGVLQRICAGPDGKGCGQRLPTSFMNGRRHLQSKCAACGHMLNSREAVPICVPIVGGRSVGKTAFITAFSRLFIEQVAPRKGWQIVSYSGDKDLIYDDITRDFLSGDTRMTARPQDVRRASAVSFSFFVEGPQFRPERLVHVYDIAGEVFTDHRENEIQQQYEYCQGIVFIIDPFSIPMVKHRYQSMLPPEDMAGIGTADVAGIIDSFMNKLRQVTGLSDSKMSSVPLAVIISKVDSGGLFTELGDAAAKAAQAAMPRQLEAFSDAQDYICRRFLCQNGMESFVNSINIKFKTNRFFYCSAIGHPRGKGAYQPVGVLEPMEWLFRLADGKMDELWRDNSFLKQPYGRNNAQF